MFVLSVWQLLNLRKAAVHRYLIKISPKTSPKDHVPPMLKAWVEVAPGLLIVSFLVLGIINNSLIVVFMVPFILFLFLMGLGVSFPGVMIGLLLANNVLSGIHRERMKRRYDLLSITLLGDDGLNWIEACVMVRRSRFAQSLLYLVQGVYTLAGGTIIFSAVVSLLVSFYQSGMDGLIEQALSVEWMFALILMLLLIYYDVLAATVMGALTGILAGRLTLERFSAQGLLIAGFIFFHMLYYPLILWLLFTRLVPWPVCVLAILVIREGVTIALWRLVRWEWYEDGTRIAGLDLRPLDILNIRLPFRR